MVLCCLGEPEAAKGRKEQQGCDVQEIQGWRTTRHPDKVLRDHKTLSSTGPGIYV